VPWGVYGVTKLFRSRYRGFLCSSFRQGLSESRLQGCRPVNIASGCYRVPSVFRARPARGSLSLACARESNQREHLPDAALPAAVREVRPGFVERPSLCVQRTRAHRARDPTDVSVLPSPRQTGTEDHKPDQKQQRAALFLCFCAQERAALASPGPHCIAAVAVGNARRGCARDRADSVVSTRMCCQRNPTADADPKRRMRAGRNALGCISLLTFFVQAKKVSRSSAGRTEALLLSESLLLSHCAASSTCGAAAGGETGAASRACCCIAHSAA